MFGRRLQWHAVNARVLAGTSRPNMTRDLEAVQQQQEKRMPSAEAAVGLGGGGIDGADARQQNSEFRVGVRLHSRGCRWPDNTSSSEMRAWSEGFWVNSKTGWSVRRLAKEAEDRIREEHGLSLAVALVLCPARDSAIPFYEPLADFVGPEESLELVGDVERVHRSGAAPSRESEGEAAAGKPEAGSPASLAKVPVTILTGFLGAGKTTMLNHLLHVQREKRIAVIENEFGEVPIDGDLLTDGDGLSAAEQVVVLDNGCMCCTVRGDLLGAFASILAKMEEATTKEGTSDGRALDSVLIETTGMADPVPIVRTLLQTPAISSSFCLDGVVTLVDAKNILPRLQQGEETGSGGGGGAGGEGKGEEEVDEAFQQIMFSDRIVVNKVDLVTSATAVEVFQRIRSINASAAIVSCSRGHIDPAELEGLQAFERLVREASEVPEIEEDQGASHSHSHSHEHAQGAEECTLDHDQDQGHGHDDCSLDHDHTEHSHSHSNRHSSQVGTFSLVKKSTEVLSLPFARWVRSLAFLPKDKGTLFRSKAVLAVAGSDLKLVFHAVSDVMERREAGRWGDAEDRSCRIVFIGKRLDRAFLEDGFNSTARVVSPKRIRPGGPLAVRGGGPVTSLPASLSSSTSSSTSASTSASTSVAGASRDESLLEVVAATVPGAFFRAMLFLGTGEVLRVGEACCGLGGAVEGDHAMEHYRTISEEQSTGGGQNGPTRSAFHLSLRRSSPTFYLHPFASTATARSYAKAAAGAKLDMIPSMGQGRTGISFDTTEDLEAAGVTWLEVEQLADPLAKNFVVEFTWRPETMSTFFESASSSTSSAMVKIDYEVEDEDSFDDEVDTLKFRLVLRPETDANNGNAAPATPLAEESKGAGGAVGGGQGGAGTKSVLPLHRLMIQTVGGRSCSQVYGLSFHSISPAFQVHVQVPDHRVPYFQTDQLFHKWHPLMEHLRKQPRLRFLVRMKPDGSGPLDNMCGCC